MMGFGEEGKKIPQKFFPFSLISNQPLSGTEPKTLIRSIKKGDFPASLPVTKNLNRYYSTEKASVTTAFTSFMMVDLSYSP